MTTKTQTNEFSTNPSDYEFVKIIGYGSSAIVHSAIYKPTNQKVAVKLIDMEMFERNQIDELRRETQVMFLCRHENLLPVYSTFVNGSKLHIVSPLLSAGSCLDILKLGYPEGLEESVIACILKQTLLGMEYLHKNGHIHRDIKAGNLLVDDQGTVLLADFGVSSSLSDGGDRQKMRKTFVGTPCWMAPEVMEQAGYDYKADIWSFGITALELANGQAPLAKFPPIKVLMMTLSKDPPTLDRDITKYKYSKSFKEMIDSCLQKDPRKRPTTEKLLQHPFFKQLSKRKQVIHQIAQSLPTIEARNIPPRNITYPIFILITNFKYSKSWNCSSYQASCKR
ncbi:kinase-like protein [Conidiobolus coronatus NRRL 28638]|uniref:Kinase-like protein n=1 Tax=Conidiobolus coronatus (strain ATCC 28846 / CBS 209.66 / NRRL 28638) TaxID=796925 RepID=A0A137NZZ4_CONC2|nr:kinase-like protein [Conidiobolus coronatus NRRL 28638]|eukprot:KXN68241.1 kinase-like protein [Conidiobolus coronatus NRRL 28638]